MGTKDVFLEHSEVCLAIGVADGLFAQLVLLHLIAKLNQWSVRTNMKRKRKKHQMMRN